MNGSGTYNTAGPNANVGAQFGDMHNSNIYMVGPEDPPERNYDAGRQYLADGVPSMAREHFERASARGFDDPSAHFHWALAILSKRSYRDLTKQDRMVLEELSSRVEPATDNHWRKGLIVVFALLSCVDGSGGNPDTATAQLNALPSLQRDLVLRHLGLVLTGSMKQGLWDKIRGNAKKNQLAGERGSRVWVYFEPEPAAARARSPRPRSTNGWSLSGGVLLAGATLFPVALLMRSALSQGSMTALLSCLALIVFGLIASWHVAYWNHKRQRVLALLKEYGVQRSLSSPPKGGFTDQVERRFDHYFAKYAPDPEHRSAWLKQTAGVRRSLRDEVARVYRESDVRGGQVNWLIRYMVRDVRRRWTEGLPLQPHEIHSLDTAFKARCVILCLFSAVAMVSVMGLAFQQVPMATVGCVLLALVAARFAIPLWLTIHSERRRHKEETQEREEILGARKDEYERWKGKLHALMPSETEMESWLDADKTLILDQALKYYRLGWSEVIAHAFLPTPDHPCKTMSVPGRPRRYSKYEIRVFLVTNEGVREASADLDFEGARWQNSERDNYRFDALSSVQVEISSEHRYTLNITLTNGPTKSVVVSEAQVQRAGDEEEQDRAATINLDAAGFPHTLRILEGIAAEGKPWFDREADPRPPDVSDPPAAA